MNRYSIVGLYAESKRTAWEAKAKTVSRWKPSVVALVIVAGMYVAAAAWRIVFGI